MKNILFIAPFDSMGRFSGGVASYAKSICKDTYFENVGLKLIPFSSSRIKRDAYSGGKFRFKNILNYRVTKKALKNELSNHKINSIYINTSRNYALFKDLLLVKRFFKECEIIVHIHFADFENVFSKRLVRSRCLSILKKKVTKIVVLSDKLKEELIKKGIDKNKIFVLRNYFNQELIKKDYDSLLGEKLHYPVEYLFVGSITLRKGIDHLLSVFSKLDDTYHLTVCGSSNDVNGDKILEKYKNLSNVTFLGFVNGKEKSVVFNQSDVFVLPTLAEGLPISLLEATNSGLGIITTSVGAIPEIIKKDNGFVISPNNEDELENAIRCYHDNFDILKQHKIQNLKESEKYSYLVFRNDLIEVLR